MMLRSIYDSIFVPPFSQEIIPHKSSQSPVKLTIAGNHKLGFDDVCAIVKRGPANTKILLINTLPIHDQDNLILHTVPYHMEETRINTILSDYTTRESDYTIVIYGRNNADDSVDKKFKQLQGLRFTNVFIYYGGMFEWMLLQDVYGTKYFPTTKPQEHDPLKYMPKRKLVE